MKLQTISDILLELYQRRVELSEDKWSGVHCPFLGTYRIHATNFLPRCLGYDKYIYDDIVNVIDINFHRTMNFDTASLWLTIKDPK